MKKILIYFFILIFILSFNLNSKPMSFDTLFKVSRLSSLSISPNGKMIVFAVKTPDMEKNNFKNEIYLTNIYGSYLKKIELNSNAILPKFLKNDCISFLKKEKKGYQLFRYNIKKKTMIKLTDIQGGIGDYIWSKDLKTFAFQKDVFPEAKSIEESVKKEEKIEKSGVKVKILTSLMYRVWNYWKDGKRSHIFIKCKDGSYKDLTPGNYDTPPVDLGGNDFTFSPDMKYFAYVKNTDKMVAISTNNDIFIKDLKTGKEICITKDNKANDFNPVFSKDGKYVYYFSMDRAGFEADKVNIKRYNLNSKKVENLTKNFKFSIKEFVISDNSRYLYFNVSESIYHPIYKMDLRSKKIKKLYNKVFSSNLNLSSNNKYIVFFNQTVKYPNEVFKLNLKNKRLYQITKFNNKILKDVEINDVETFNFIGAKNEKVEGILLKPANFDKNKKYPMVFLIHGGPQGAWGDDFHFRWNLAMFSSPGYVVVAINFHGSRGYGQKFTDSVSGDWGGAPFIDLVKGEEFVVNNYKFIDKDRIVAAGASYGGFMINWIAGHWNSFKYPFKCLVSHDGIFDSRSMYYETEELWFEEWEHKGTPWTSDLFEKWNPARFVENFKIPMLIVHGEHDYRVPPSQGLMLFTALQRRGIESKMLYFPDEYHFVVKPKNAKIWWSEVFNWFKKHIEK